MSDGSDPLEGIATLDELEPLARDVMDEAAFDYVAGGSWDEISLDENEIAWRRRRFRPRVLVDVSSVDPSTTMLGVPVAFPVAVAPMAVQGLAHPEGELAAVRGAAAAGVPYILSTTSSRSMEEVAAAAPDARRWFQLYVQSDAARTRRLVERAAAAGYGAIVLTVDLPLLGYRDRDRRSGFALPPLGNFRDVGATHGSHAEGEPELQNATSLTWDHLAEIRGWSGLPLVLKGILTAEDARLAVEHGADAVVVSNHGGRQLDRVQAGVDALAEVVAAVGRPDRGLGRRRRASRPRHRDRPGARRARRADRPAGLLGAGDRRRGGCRARPRDPPRRIRDRARAAGHAHPGRCRAGAPRRAGRDALLTDPEPRHRRHPGGIVRPARPVAGWRSSGPLLGAW